MASLGRWSSQIPTRFRSAVLRIHSERTKFRLRGCTLPTDRQVASSTSLLCNSNIECPPTPGRTSWFEYVPVSLAATRNHLLSLPPGTRCFSSLGLSSFPTLCIQIRIPYRYGGFPHSEIFGSKLTFLAPRSISALIPSFIDSGRHQASTVRPFLATKLKLKAMSYTVIWFLKEHVSWWFSKLQTNETRAIDEQALSDLTRRRYQPLWATATLLRLL